MNSTPIYFFYEKTAFRVSNVKKVRSWLAKIIHSEGYTIDSINYIICNDDYLIKINKQYLNHDYYTDIITFSNSENPALIEADIFISIDRVKENAKTQENSLLNELHRVLVHGLLHLMGYNDGSDKDKIMMRKKEDGCLSLRAF